MKIYRLINTRSHTHTSNFITNESCFKHRSLKFDNEVFNLILLNNFKTIELCSFKLGAYHKDRQGKL